MFELAELFEIPIYSLVWMIIVIIMEPAFQRDDRTNDAKATAIRELDLMQQAIDNNQLKKALFHKKLADAAIDEMGLNDRM